MQRLVDDAFGQMRRSDAELGQVLDTFTAEDDVADLQRLTRAEVIDLCTAAEKNPVMITLTIEACGEAYARRLFTHRLVDQVLRLRGTGRLVLDRYREGA